MTDHAELRAMLDEMPWVKSTEYFKGTKSIEYVDGSSVSIPIDKDPENRIDRWLLRAPSLVRAMLEERDDLAEQLAARPRADVYITAASHNEAMRALEQERDALRNEVKMWRSTADSLKADRDQLAKRIEDQSDAPEWLSAVDEALGEDRKKAPFIDDAVKLLRKERDAILAENRRLRETNNCLKAERDALKAEVERLRAKPVTPEQLFSSPKVIWEGWVRARDEEGGCVLDLFNIRAERSRYARVVEADPPEDPSHEEHVKAHLEFAKKYGLDLGRVTTNPFRSWFSHPSTVAHALDQIAVRTKQDDELRLRCEMAATVLPILAQWGKEHGIEGPFRDAVVNEAHNYADALLAEGRGRMAAEREGGP